MTRVPMNTVLGGIAALVFLSGCATMPGVDVTPININPITQTKSDPFDPEEKLELAQSAFESENYTIALKEYAALLAFNPEDAPARLGAGNSFLALGNFDKAASVFWAEMPQLDDEESDEWATGKTLSGIYVGKHENNETAIHDGLELAPNDPRLWNAKGQMHDRQQEWMDALNCYVTALDIGKSRTGTINNMGMSLLLQKRYPEAQEKFQNAKDLSPDTNIYDNNWRMSQILMGDHKLALSDIDETRGSNILNDAGYVAMQSDRMLLAEHLFNKALEISPVFHEKAQANLDALLAVQLEAAASAETTGPAP